MGAGSSPWRKKQGVTLTPDRGSMKHMSFGGWRVRSRCSEAGSFQFFKKHRSLQSLKLAPTVSILRSES